MSSISIRFSPPAATDSTTVVVCPDLSRPDRGLEPARVYRLSAYGALMAMGTDAAIAVVDEVFSLIPSAAVRTAQAATSFIESAFARIVDGDQLAVVWIVGTQAYAASTDPETFSISILSASGTATRLGITARQADSTPAYRGSVITLHHDGATASAGIIEGPSPRVAAPAVVAPAPAAESQKTEQADQEVIIWSDNTDETQPAAAAKEESSAPGATVTDTPKTPNRRRKRIWIFIAIAAAIVVALLNMPTCSDADHSTTGSPADSTATEPKAAVAAASTDSAAEHPDTIKTQATAEPAVQSAEQTAPGRESMPVSKKTPGSTSSTSETDAPAAPTSSQHKNFNISPEVDTEE